MRGLREDDRGAALVTTIGILGAVSLLLAAILSSSVSALRQSAQDVNWHAALAAAEAGVEDYLYRINSDPYYWERAPTLPGTDGDPANDVANPDVDTTNAAYTAFVDVPGAANGARFTYTVDPLVRFNGTIRITSTGLVGNRTRTITTTLRRRSFLDYVYVSTYETRDPDQYETWPPSDNDAETGRGGTPVNDLHDNDGRAPLLVGPDAAREAEAQCAHFRYAPAADRPASVSDSTPGYRADRLLAGWSGRHPDCSEPHWTTDVFDGPYHSNDATPIRQDGSGRTRFPRTPVSTSWGVDADGNPGTPLTVPAPGFLDVHRVVNGHSAAAQPEFPYTPPRPLYSPPLDLPPENQEVRDAAADGGYVFTGPTRIVLRGDRLWVQSELTPGYETGRDVALPPNGVVYVDDAGAADCTGWLPPLGPVPAMNGYPAVPDYRDGPVGIGMYPSGVPGAADADITPYGCSDGDVYVEGELRGRLTLAAEHDVVVTWHIGYASTPRSSSTASGYSQVSGSPAPPTGDRDLLGLVSGLGSVKLFKPVVCRAERYGICQHGHNITYRAGSGTGRATPHDLTIYAAILAPRHSMRLLNQMIGGPVGTLFIHGSIGQKFRGNLGTANGNALPRGYTSTPYPAIPPNCFSSFSDNGTTVQTLYRSGGTCNTRGGFSKVFSYDDRLQYLSPPSFLQPVNVSWAPFAFAEDALDDGHRGRLPVPGG